MQELSVWKTVKIGFWLGIGFIIPQMIVLYSGTVLTVMSMPSMMESAYDIDSEYDVDENDESIDISEFTDNFDVSKHIVIEEHRESLQGDQLLILGSIRNNGKKTASSIQLEAELMDEAGKFVYECSEYISKKIKKGESENFQIKCGCGKIPLPKYTSINLRVVSAVNY